MDNKGRIAVKKLFSKLNGFSVQYDSNCVYILPNESDNKPDRYGRIIIPLEIINEFGLERDVYVIGVGDRIEIWNKKDWENYFENLKLRFGSNR